MGRVKICFAGILALTVFMDGAMACSDKAYGAAMEDKDVQEEWAVAKKYIENYEKAKRSGKDTAITEARSKLQIQLVVLSNFVDASSGNQCGMRAQLEIKRRFDEINAKYPGKRGGLFKW